ncbi:ribosome maturation factor RimP [Rhodococcus aetherivorans]|jgi:ribosome maturation factor RimP|uniref:Ribosome maturation factor RimP n=1 Tax=Rhodococcus aetherivorans TaxID=191292 RepID=N1M8W8_9NOCA|nr:MULTISPECIES: ribosome maturation factor RimP [Rhodococcus]NCL72867.1 Ribosome maturation factor RimP [Rhodococcus sp. YH1]AKE89778.1 ribosome maturation protein RimP [Rhodococcus aetherivorans]ANZ25502.1 ribosome maturation factor RimP [Rhodococcus sp. WB1]MBC2587238.1 ribosome maturation factor RimP [Rhodococcus aetherivorans]MDV6291696.1 ribosome maturation factor RimP [Rhodococcus aetherivorans]
MPVPPPERIAELVSGPIEREGYDLEDVVITSAGKHSTVRLFVDSDAGLSLDEAARLSTLVSEAFDAVSDFGESPYVLEVTSPGIGRPLTRERHWRRSQARKARIELDDETIVGRIGELVGDEVRIVVPGRSGPSVRAIPLAEVRRAVVEVEFNAPNPRELELAGGLPDGRVRAGEIAEGDGDDPDDESGTDYNGTDEVKVDK